jgi:hypothetical protein
MVVGLPASRGRTNLVTRSRLGVDLTSTAGADTQLLVPESVVITG